MTADQFHNALRIMMSLSASDLLRAGVVNENWGTPGAAPRDQLNSFVINPFREALRMPDANFARLWSLIESRQPRRASNVVTEVAGIASDLEGIRDDIAAIAEQWSIDNAIAKIAAEKKAQR